MKRIYLDESCWIDLRNLASSGPAENHTKSLLNLCRSMSESGEWIFPLSIWHLIETQNTYNNNRRLNLGEMQAELSKGWKLATYPAIKQYEVEGYLLNQPSIFVSQKVFSHGTSIPDYEIAQLVDETTQDDVKQAKQIYDNWGVNSLIFAQQAEQYSSFSADKQEQLEYIKLLSGLRKSPGYSFADFCMENFKKYFSFQEQLAILRKILKSMSGLSQNVAREKLMCEFEKLPSFFTAMKLLWELILQKSEDKLERNDFTDIIFLSSAIPYCDIVVTEKQWVSYAKKHKLDLKYQTALYPDMQSLFEIE